MRPGAETYADLFTMNYKAIRALTRDVTEAEARRRPDGVRNPMLWLAGHLATYRAAAIDTLGAAPPPRGQSLKCFFGKDVRADEAAWPALASVLEDLGELHTALVARLLTLGEAAFEKTTEVPGGARVPAIVFLHFHESYHVGQLGYVRTWLGKSPLVAPGPAPVTG
jgi:hypothetical protein